MNETLNRIEEALNLDNESISSSSWWVGSAGREYDHLMPEEDQALVKACEEKQ